MLAPRTHSGDRPAAIWRKPALALLIVTVVVTVWLTLGSELSLERLARREAQLREWQQRAPLLISGGAFALYVLVTGLSLPGAAALSLVYGWFFGLVHGVLLVSFASTLGATLAFLLSRFLFHDLVAQRFGERLSQFNKAWEQEGAFFLFLLRLIPVVPFFAINAVMGLTPIRTRTFWWVSQLGMLPGTMVYLYAGSSVPSLQNLAERGLHAVLSPEQLAQILLAFSLLGLFPLLVRWMVKLVRTRTVRGTSEAAVAPQVIGAEPMNPAPDSLGNQAPPAADSSKS